MTETVRAALARLSAEQSARLAGLDPAFAALPAPPVEADDAIIAADGPLGPEAAAPEAVGALAVVRTQVSGPESPSAVWGTLVAHVITLRIGSSADPAEIAAVLAAALSEVRTRDAVTARRGMPIGSGATGVGAVTEAAAVLGTGDRFGAGALIDEADRRIRVTVPAREIAAAQGLARAGFHLESVDALRRLTDADTHLRHADAHPISADTHPAGAADLRPAGASGTVLAGASGRVLAGASGAVRSETPSTADEDALTEALMALHAFDAGFMSNRLRPGTREAMRAYARTAIAAGAGWTQIVRATDGGIAALLTVSPPGADDWAAAGLDTGPGGYVGVNAYVGFAHTIPAARGRGLASALLSRALAHARDCGVDSLLIGYAAQNPLSGPLWSLHGFRPLRTHWVRPVH